jgi:Lanthionine synthetase C-like protein
MLFRPEAFEPLTDTNWDADRVGNGIRAIVADADDSLRGPKLMWPAHEWDGWHGTSPMKNLYVGTAGVLWGLDRLRCRGLAETRLDLADLARRNVQLFRARPDFMRGMKLPDPREAALMTGESGILLVAWRLAADDTFADELLDRVRANVDNPAEEVMWGSPGTLIAARAMLDWTGDGRWREAWHETAEALLARRGEDGLWVQRLYAQEAQSLMPLHGVVGNVRALLPLIDEARARRLQRDTNAILARAAVVEDGLANWPPSNRPRLPGPDGQIRVQWCAGAPGIVEGAAEYMDEELVLAGAELAWRTGPPNLDKGPGICHGTAGNGYAFLKTFERTGDEQWLERARRFAMHALEQVDRLREERGRGRYSLWTGDVGVALYAADCIDGRAEYPFFDAV